MSNQLEIAKDFFNFNKDGWVEKKVKSVGGGDWSIEVYGKYRDANGVIQKRYLFEVVGSNGTLNNEISSDLHSIVDNTISAACSS